MYSVAVVVNNNLVYTVDSWTTQVLIGQVHLSTYFFSKYTVALLRSVFCILLVNQPRIENGIIVPLNTL